MAVDADSARQLTEPTDQEISDADTYQATTGDADRPARQSLPVNELCPALIWQLRNSAAAHYRPPPG